MKEKEVVTITGAAGGTGLAATELCLSKDHPVFLIICFRYHSIQVICIVKGEKQESFLSSLLHEYYPTANATIIDSERSPSFKNQIKELCVGF